MIPKTLDEWSIILIKKVLEKKIFESDTFDFKKELPYGNDVSGKDRLKKTCCAFANSDGGFLIFGVADDKSLSVEERLIGIDEEIDFPEQFGNYPKKCSPSVYWDFKNPPLKLSNGNNIHIVFIPKSWQAPHSVGSHEEGWHFTKRTNKGNEGMSTEEIRNNFLGFYEKRLKLELLRSEIQCIMVNADSSYYSTEDDISELYSLVTFNLNVIESVISDTYSITARKPDLLQALSQIREKARIANTRINLLHSQVALPLTNIKQTVKAHNESMQVAASEIKTCCEIACLNLNEILNNKST